MQDFFAAIDAGQYDAHLVVLAILTIVVLAVWQYRNRPMARE